MGPIWNNRDRIYPETTTMTKDKIYKIKVLKVPIADNKIQ